MTDRSTLDPLARYGVRTRTLDDAGLDAVGDEMLGDDGVIRAHWSGVADAYRTMGLAEITRRRDEIQRLLEQDGVTYNVSADERHRRSWMLDPIPFVVPGDEWDRVERGMVQRAELLDLVLRDLYGERRLLRSGLVPSEMILADPEFTRSCDGITIPGEKQLVVFGADLARSGDGRWVTLGQRTHTPSGAAYALENRRVLSRVFPQLFRATRVQPLTPFIEALRLALLAAAPANVEDPTIVILSPGSLSETAFEHASLAAQLGFQLVQGSDFQCRGGRVGLRAVGGWVPVHVILRRVDTGFCDPLALRSSSTLGIPGLVDACRAGTVSVVNTLGSGVLENAGLAGLMSTLSTHLLGTDLLLDSIPSWWCGDERGRSHVLANLDTLVVRPLSRSALGHSVDTARASAGELDTLRKRILDNPGQWVGQERVQPTTAPTLTAQGIEPRAAVLRAFAIARGDTYVAMPGGLARSASDDPDMPITNRLGATSKDTWILTSGAVSRADVWPTDPDINAHAPTDALPARAAENLFWLGRYAERAEATIRLIRTINARRAEFDRTSPGPGQASLTVLLEALTRVTGTYPGFVGDDAATLFDDPTDELFSLVVDDRRPGSVAHAILHMFDAIDVVRDQLSIDTWLVVGSMQRELERLEHHAEDHAASDRDEATTSVLNALLNGLLSLSGLASESMVRDLGWQFMEAGRRIERALHVAGLVGSALGTERSAPVESLVLESVLVAGESIITARRRYRTRALTSTTIGLLFHDGGNPRALRFQLDRLGDSLDVLRDEDSAAMSPVALQRLEEVRSLLDAADASTLALVDEHGYRRQLDQFVSTARSVIASISEAIAADSFSRFRAQHPMIGPIAVTRPVDSAPAGRS
jgi:uncharacterized circularly permuted ATP-grasp superfamily protein/uncharacterized alpha-E superfamily protein